MNIYSVLQQALDGTIHEKYGIQSFHLRKAETNNNMDCYIVYSLVSTQNHYGDGTSLFDKYSIDVNFYYDRDTISNEKVEEVLNEIKKTLKKSGFVLRTGERDIYDSMALFKGLNLEFIYIGIPNEE